MLPVGSGSSSQRDGAFTGNSVPNGNSSLPALFPLSPGSTRTAFPTKQLFQSLFLSLGFLHKCGHFKASPVAASMMATLALLWNHPSHILGELRSRNGAAFPGHTTTAEDAVLGIVWMPTGNASCN